MKTRTIVLISIASLCLVISVLFTNCAPPYQPGNPNASNSPTPETTKIKSGFFNLVSDPAIAAETYSVGTRETNIQWVYIERENNDYNWSELDKRIQNAQSGNQEDYVVLHPGRRKFNSNWPPVLFCSQSTSCALASNAQFTLDQAKAEWKDFLIHVFERYDFDGTEDMEGLTRAFTNWQIGNEYESKEQFSGAQENTKDDYLIVLQTAWEAKNASTPKPTLILSGLTYPEKIGRCYSNPPTNEIPNPDCNLPSVRWQKYVLENAKSGSEYYYDVIDLHIFNWSLYKPNLIKEAVAGIKLTPSKKPLVTLEWTAAFGWFDFPQTLQWQGSTNRPLNGDCTGPSGIPDGVQDSSDCTDGSTPYINAQKSFEKHQGEDIVRVFTSLVGQGLGQIGMIYVQFSDWHKDWCFSAAWNYQGLLRKALPPNVCTDSYQTNPAYPTLAKKPAWYNYQKLMKSLDNYESVSEISNCPECYGYKFVVGGETRVIIWSASATAPALDVDLSAYFESTELCYNNFVTELDDGLNPIYPSSIVYTSTAVDVAITPAIVTKKQGSEACQAF